MKIPHYSPHIQCQSVNQNLNLSFNSRSGVRKRHRTHFTGQQVEKLESIFKQTTNPNRDLVVQLSTLLNLTDKNISIWFKNRRAKCRREQSNNKIQEKLITDSLEQKAKIPVNTIKFSWTEQMTYPNHHRQDETFSEEKSLSTSHGNTIAPIDVSSAHFYYGSTKKKIPNLGTKNDHYLSDRYTRNTSFMSSTNYPVPPSNSEYVPSNIELSRKSMSVPITPPLSNESRPSTSTSSSEQLSNIYPTDSSNFSWNSNLSHSTAYASTGTSSNDSSSLANISDSSSLSSVSSSQENELYSVSMSTPLSSIAQYTYPKPLVPQSGPQTTYPYEYSQTRSHMYHSMTSSPNNVSYLPRYDDSIKHFNYPSLRSMTDVQW